MTVLKNGLPKLYYTLYNVIQVQYIYEQYWREYKRIHSTVLFIVENYNELQRRDFNISSYSHPLHR